MNCDKMEIEIERIVRNVSRIYAKLLNFKEGDLRKIALNLATHDLMLVILVNQEALVRINKKFLSKKTKETKG